jgi:multisubunit Na+/H+ antiporter MnhC subunit
VLGLPPGRQGLAPQVADRLEDHGVSNPVTGVLLDFRAYDTLMESVVLLVALVAVWALTPASVWGGVPGMRQRARPDGVLAMFGRLLPPIGLVVAVYLVWAGSSQPGGAFQAGTVLAAVWLLVVMAGDLRRTAGLQRLAAHGARRGAGPLPGRRHRRPRRRRLLAYPEEYAYGLILHDRIHADLLDRGDAGAAGRRPGEARAMTGTVDSALLFALTGCALIGLGLYGFIVHAHLLRRILAFNVIGSGIFLLFGALGYLGIGQGTDPVPQALIITGIVVALSLTAFAVALSSSWPRRRTPSSKNRPTPGSTRMSAGFWASLPGDRTVDRDAAGRLLAGDLLGGRIAPRLVIGVAPIMLGLAGLVAWQVAVGGPSRVALGGWEAPLGIALFADGLSGSFLLLTAIVMSMVGFRRHKGAFDARGGETTQSYSFWALFFGMWAALNGVFLGADFFNLYVAIELLTITAVGMVALGGTRAAIRYLLFALAGSLAYLTGVVLLYAEAGTLDMALLAANEGDASVRLVAGALMTAGLLAKTALFPLHAWLPPAHGGAPAPASAMLSALVVKASFVITCGSGST